MPESEEDLRRYLREKIAEEERETVMAQWGRRTRLPALDPLFGDLTLGEAIPQADDAPAADVQAAPPTSPAETPPVLSAETPLSPAPLPPPLAAVPAAPPASAAPTVPAILRALAVFILVTALGGIALLAQRSAQTPTAWVGVGLGLAVCAALLFLAGRSGDRHDPGNPPIVR